MGVSDSTKNAEVDPRTASASSAMDSDVTNLNESAGTDSDVTDPNQSAGTDSAAPEKPLKSILKKRKPERIPEETNAEHQNVEPPAKIPKGGSITEALKLITAIADESDDEAEDDSNPKPSAFILEMEKQKAQQSALSSGPVPSPNIPTCTPNPIGTDQYLEAFVVRQANQNVKVSQVNVGTQQFRRKRSALTPYDDVIDSSVNPDLTVPIEHPPDTTKWFRGVILITNLPFKATKDEILSILGICPKGGKDGIRLILERSALPAGFAYVIVERHSDMMDLLRLDGLKWQGRKLKFSKSSRDNLIRDWKITKVALAELDKSRVIQVKKLPFFLKKYRLIDALDGINIGPEDIYWQPLRPEQTNSGRGFIVLSSSEEAKKVNSRKFSLAGCRIEVAQVHPSDLKRFAHQCKMKLDSNLCLLDDLPGDLDDISDLNLEPEKPDFSRPGVISKSEEIVTSNSSTQNFDQRPRVTHSIHQNTNRHPPHASFLPTIFVRLFNVPEKATTADIRSFFEPVLPAKIAQNIGYNIWDVEFYNPNDGMQAMSKQNLMIRKNVIHLQMLPGAPHPLPPRHSGSAHVTPRQSGPIPPQFIPPGVPMMMPPPHMMRVGPQFPGMMGPAIPHPAYPQSFQNFHPPAMHPRETIQMNSSSNASIDPHTMPPPMSERGGAEAIHGGNQHRRLRSPSPDRKRRLRSPEHVPPPKKELIPVPPLPDDITKYTIPPFEGQTPVGQAMITTMQGYFCQLCNKFYNSRVSAKDTHCKTRGHYDKLKMVLQEKKRLRKLAEAEHTK